MAVMTMNTLNSGERKATLYERAFHEFKRFVAMFFYLWALFGVFVINESIVLAQHNISYRAQGFAVLNALVLAKVMLIAEDLRLGHRFKDRPLIYPILYKSFLFALVFIGFHIVEGVLVGVASGKTISESFPEIGGGRLTGVFSAGAVIFVTLIPFFAFREISRVIGERELWSLIFRRGKKDYKLSVTQGAEEKLD